MLSLAEARPGKIYRVVEIVGGRRVFQSLYDLGIVPGARVEVLNTSFLRGPVRVRVAGSDVALGRGVAMKVLVEEVG